jgi:hypothetical protein
MRKAYILSLVLLFTLIICADDYKILQLNTSYVRIGNRNCTKGDVFSDESVIFWEQDKQAFKAQNLKTKEIKLFAEPDFRAKGSKTIKDYYVKTNRLSSRGNEASALDEISDTVYLCDSIFMDIPVELDSVHYCYVVYNDQAGKVQKRLRYKDQGFFIEKDLFDEKIREKDIQVDLFYHMPDEEYLLKESLTIVFIPWE